MGISLSHTCELLSSSSHVVIDGIHTYYYWGHALRVPAKWCLLCFFVIIAKEETRFYFLCMYGNFAYVYVCVPHARSECLKKPEEGVRYPGPGVPGVRDLHVSAGRPKPSPRLPLPFKITVSLQSIACVRTESLCYRRKTVYHSFIIGGG